MNSFSIAKPIELNFEEASKYYSAILKSRNVLYQEEIIFRIFKEAEAHDPKTCTDFWFMVKALELYHK